MGMKSMYDLRDMLCKELDEISRKGELGAGDLDIVHKLASTIKNLDKIEAIPAAITTTICAIRTVGASLTRGGTMSAGITAARTQLSTCAARSTI